MAIDAQDFKGQVLLSVCLALLVLGGWKGWELTRDRWRGAAPVGQAPRPPVPELQREVDVCRGDLSQLAAQLEEEAALARGLQEKLAAIAPARATAKTGDPSLVLQQFMQLSDVDAILGQARSSEMTTCGGGTPRGGWQCLRRRYCTPKGCVSVTFQDNDGWKVNHWGKY